MSRGPKGPRRQNGDWQDERRIDPYGGSDIPSLPQANGESNETNLEELYEKIKELPENLRSSIVSYIDSLKRKNPPT